VTSELKDLFVLAMNLLVAFGIPVGGAIVAGSIFVSMVERAAGVRMPSFGLTLRLGAGISAMIVVWERSWMLLRDLGTLAFR
jgi:hypothetical protein